MNQSFTIFVTLLTGEVEGRQIDSKTTLSTLKDTFNFPHEDFDLVYAGDILTDELSVLHPDAEVQLVESILPEVKRAIKYKETGFFEFGTACNNKYKEQQRVEFPEPRDLDINMMPIVLGDKESLPDDCKQYWPIIHFFENNVGSQGDICYLTIQESVVKAGTSQRRPGLHIETPGCVENLPPQFRLGFGSNQRLNWGDVAMRISMRGGIIMASNVPNSCKIYNVRLNQERLTEKGFIGPHGDVSHLREHIEKACELRDAYTGSWDYDDDDPEWNTWKSKSSTTMKPNTMYWLTDRTPHESLPLEQDTYRQYFRLVSSDISAWFADHSTPNPKGIVPPEEVVILKGNKFEDLASLLTPEEDDDDDY